MVGSQLADLERLLQCDDMFLARLIAGTAKVPAELDTPVLRLLRLHARSSQWRLLSDEGREKEKETGTGQ